MIGSTAIALVETPVMTHLGPEPSYCVGRTLLSKPLTPSQWATCWNYGMHQPVPGMADASRLRLRAQRAPGASRPGSHRPGSHRPGSHRPGSHRPEYYRAAA
jgi:hypothetical protein